MTLSVIGPLNNIWGPGLLFNAESDATGVPQFGDRFNVFFHIGATAVFTEVVGFATGLDNSNHSVPLIIQPDTAFPSFRTGASAGGQVRLTIQRVNNAGTLLEPSQTLGPVTWDPTLQLQVLIHNISSGGGGGLTPAQAQQLEDIFNFVSTVYRNRP